MRYLLMFFAVTSFMIHADDEKNLTPICEGLAWKGNAPFELSRNEEGFVCGFSEMKSWNEIPMAQARLHLRAFLQKRGYLDPEFDRQGNMLVIDPGKIAKTAAVEFQNMPENFFDDFQPRGLKNQTLNPAFLDKWTGITESRLHNIGFPCAEAKALADPDLKKVWVQAEPGRRLKITEIKRPDTPLKKDVWQRYDAFHLNEYYDGELLALTTARLKREALAESSYFEHECTDEGVHLRQYAYLGPRQFVAIGVGATTEEYPILRVRWRNSRLDNQGTSIEALSRVSSREQSVDLSSDLYFWPDQPWLSFVPGVVLEREQERAYETTSLRWLLHLSYERDDLTSRWFFRFGPTQNYQWNVVGPSADYQNYLSFEGHISRVSHEYELYITDPYQGYEWSLNAKSQRENLFAEVDADMLEFSGTVLWNVQNWRPPWWVVGFRYRTQTIFSEERDSRTSQLGPDFRSYLGGDQSVRGFGRNEIDGQGFGYFTTVYLGGELRYANSLPYNIDPFLLADFGMKGYRSGTLDEGYVWSPGFGVRWDSFIGVFRFTFARGIVKDEEIRRSGVDSHNQFFLSYGVEF